MRAGVFIRWLAFWGCLSLSVSTVMAEMVSPTALASLSQRLSAIHSMSADFKQVLRDETGALMQTSEGHMAWQRPDHFYWSITMPEKQLIVADGHWVWQYNPGLKEVQRQPLRHQAGTPMALLSGSVDQLGQQFDVSSPNAFSSSLPAASSSSLVTSSSLPVASSSPRRRGSNLKTPREARPFTYRLSPKNPEAPFHAIALTFVDGKLTHMRFEDALEQVTDFYFTHIKTNIKLPSALFHFEPPADAGLAS